MEERTGWGRRRRGISFRVWVIIITCCILAAAFGSRSIFNVGAGEAGVLFDPLNGGVQPTSYGEGLHYKNFWANVSHYSVKTQDYTMSVITEEGQLARDDRVRTVTKEGLYVGLDITVLYRVDAAKAPEIRRSIGTETQYQEVVVRPNIRSTIREIVSRHDASEVYGSARALVEKEIFDDLSAIFLPRGIILESILLRDVELPAEITTAIEAKKSAEQEALRMQYVLEREKLEAQRKVVEAGGIADANEIIAGSLSPQYLTWYWIDNLEHHENVIYLLPSEGGLPLMPTLPVTPEGE